MSFPTPSHTDLKPIEYTTTVSICFNSQPSMSFHFTIQPSKTKEKIKLIVSVRIKKENFSTELSPKMIYLKERDKFNVKTIVEIKNDTYSEAGLMKGYIKTIMARVKGGFVTLNQREDSIEVWTYT